MLRSGLTLYCYVSTYAGSYVARGYQRELDNLKFTTVSPGGFGSLSCKIRLPDNRTPRPELELFSRVALMNGQECLFLGEVSDAAVTLDNTGIAVSLQALGLGSTLRDDTRITSYLNKTPVQIMTDQFSIRSAYLVIDSDQSLIFPDNPAGTVSPAYTNRTMEEVIADLSILAGDYAWGVWGHPRNKDAYGFPTAQLSVQQRDVSTTHYTAADMSRDIVSYTITPSMDRAYNVVKITYFDPTLTTPVGIATYADARLAGDGSQGTAPFRRRVFSRDFSSTSTINQAQAQNIANTYGAQFQNVSNKVKIVLQNVRGPNGEQVDLYRVRADRNIAIPEMALRGVQLPTTLTAGTNQYYIVQSTYTETTTSQQLELQCDNYSDDANVLIARLQLANDAVRRASSVTNVTQSQGAPEKGWCGGGFNNTAAALTYTYSATFKTTMINQPTSITLTPVSVANAINATVTLITVNGFAFNITTTNSFGYYFAYYQTVGNCLVSVDEQAKTVTRHCDVCDRTMAFPMSDLHIHDDGVMTGMSHACACGAVESYNCRVTSADATGDTHRAEQARLIRACMALCGLAVQP